MSKKKEEAKSKINPVCGAERKAREATKLEDFLEKKTKHYENLKLLRTPKNGRP